MKALHGPEMAKISVAFVAALLGVFVMQFALQGDRRLVLAGFRAREAVLARLSVLISATGLVVAVSAVVTALFFTPASWARVIAALVLIGLIYAAIGALAGALLDKLAATYLILFLVMTDLGVVSRRWPRHTRPAAVLLGYGSTRGARRRLSPRFHAGGELLLAVG